LSAEQNIILSIVGNGVSLRAMRIYTQKASVLRVRDIIKSPAVLDGRGVFEEEGVLTAISAR